MFPNEWHCVLVMVGLCYADSLTNMVEEEGYTVERHTVTTEDNYILGFHRIPARKSGAKTVFLMHGLLNSGCDYVMFGPKYSLGYILADAGYDVWLGNARGTQFSRRHTNLDPDSSKFWDYSFHEIGKYDLPAMIDYALTKTNRSSLHYIGHSQGCTSFFAMLALRPEYNAKIATMHAMAAAVFIGDFTAISPLLARNFDTIQSFADALNVYEISMENATLRSLHPKYGPLCRDKTLMQIICVNAFFYVAGSQLPVLTTKYSSNMMRNTPAGASIKQLAHYSQMVITDRFLQYDYKATRNQKLYGLSSPPDYNISNITADIYPMYGPLDDLAPPTGMRRFIKSLGSCVKQVHFIAEFNHVDFIYSRFAKRLVYRLILKDIRQYGV